MLVDARGRSGTTVLVVAPGFGFLANPEQLRCVEQAGFTVKKCFVPNPEDSGFNMASAIPTVLADIQKTKPGVILCASKGGAYLVELWRLMSLGTLEKIPSLMINVHPQCWKQGLPEGVKIILVQGSEEEIWWKARGYEGATCNIASDSLESLIRTGSPKLCYLHYTLTKNGVRKRIGDRHNVRSLLEHDCLPRLIDSLLSDCPHEHFQQSSACFTSVDRQERERYLGFEPRSLKKFWSSTGQNGHDAQKRFDVDPVSEEFDAVCAIFTSDPAVRKFYHPHSTTAALDITQIERVENGNLQVCMDANYGNMRTNAATFGDFVGGVHTRWLFHGTSSAEAMDSIVNDPQQG